MKFGSYCFVFSGQFLWNILTKEKPHNLKNPNNHQLKDHKPKNNLNTLFLNLHKKFNLNNLKIVKNKSNKQSSNSIIQVHSQNTQKCKDNSQKSTIKSILSKNRYQTRRVNFLNKIQQINHQVHKNQVYWM